MSIEWVYCSCLENCTEKIGSAMHVPIFFQLKNSSGPSGWHICAMSRNVLWSGWANTFQVDECGGSPHPWNILELSRAERNSGSWDVESWRQESMTQHSSFGSIRSRRRHDPPSKWAHHRDRTTGKPISPLPIRPHLDETFFLAGLAPSFFLELQLTKVSRSISSQPECLAYQGTVSFAGF